MQLTDEEISEFIRIWQEEYHELLTADTARLRARALLELYAVLAQSNTEEKSVTA